MKVEGTIYDLSTGDPIPGASVSVVDASGKSTGEGVAADGNGHFLYSGTVLDSAGYLLFTSVGYKSLLVPYGIVLEQGGVQLEKTAQELPGVVVTPSRKKASNGALLAAGTLLVLAKAAEGKGGRIGQAEGGKTDWTKIILPIGIIGVGYFLVRTITNTLGLTETAEQKKQREQQQGVLQQSQDQVYKQYPLTKTPAEWLAIADIIYNDLRSSSPLFNNNNTDDAGYQIARPKNLADVFKLIEMFGSRQQSIFGITGPSMTLPEFIRKELSSDQIATVNNNFTRKGIAWQW